MTSIYEEIALELGKLVTEKNAAYGDSFAKSAKFLELLYPNGVQVHQYQDMLALARDFDKSARIATDEDAFGENPWGDKGGYAILSVAQRRMNSERHFPMTGVASSLESFNSKDKTQCRKAPLKLCSEDCCIDWDTQSCKCEVPIDVANKT